MNKAQYCIISVLIILSLSGCFLQRSTWRRNVAVPSHLYLYSGAGIIEAIEELGVASNTISEIRRNGSGHLIIVREDDMLAGWGRSKRAFVFSKESGMTPREVVPPDKASWYNLGDDGQVLAWGKNDSIIHFSDGRQFDLRRVGGSSVGFDYGGRFMYMYNHAKKVTSIYHTSSLEEPVAQFDANQPPIELYVQGERLLVYGLTRHNQMVPRSQRDDSIWEFRIFERKNRSFVEVLSVPLPKEGYLEAVDQWSDLVLVRQYRDVPLFDKYFLLNTRSGEFTKLGALRQGIYVFLTEDVLGGDRLASLKVSQLGASTLSTASDK